MLQSIGVYLFKVILVSGLLLLYYFTALYNKRFHYYNRFYLLFTLIASLMLPLLHLQWFSFSSDSQQTIKLYNLMYTNGAEKDAALSVSSFSPQTILLFACAVIAIVSFIALIIKTTRLYQLKKQYPVQKMQEFDFINTNLKQAPFSFLKNIFWRSDISLNDITGRQILQHEMIHVQQKHSYDKLLMQTVLCFLWMNPFFWLLRRELYLIHEFIADEKSVNENDTSAFAKMLLAAQFGKFSFLPAQSFYYSSIKRRLIMLTQSKNSKFSYLRRLMVLPLLLFVVGLFAFSIKNHNAADGSVVKANAPFKLIINAGHGGKDFGATANGIYEKDLALAIALKMKALAAQYGINAVLTREDDRYMSPQNITEFTTAHNANAFIAVHVNSAPGKDSSGMEVLISNKDKQYIDKSRLLASAVLQNISTDFTASHALLQTRNVGIWVLDHNSMPAVLIECGYMSNNADLKMLQDDSKIDLIANNILQGVTAYANNKTTSVNNGELSMGLAKDTMPTNVTVTTTDKEHEPLYIVDGKEMSAEDFKKGSLQPDQIISINVWKDEKAKEKYGEKGKYGVIEIISKKKADKASDTTSLQAPWNKYLASTFKPKGC